MESDEGHGTYGAMAISIRPQGSRAAGAELPVGALAAKTCRHRNGASMKLQRSPSPLRPRNQSHPVKANKYDARIADFEIEEEATRERERESRARA